MSYAGKLKELRLPFLALLSMALLSSEQASCGSPKDGPGRYVDQPFSAYLHYIADGDSFIVKKEDVRISIRLWGIDAPEFDQPYAKASRAALEQFLSGKKIHIAPKYVDRYGRLVAIAEIDHAMVNSMMIGGGNAWVHPYYCNETVCDQWYKLQEKARRDRKGLWDGDPVEPWVWKMKK